MFLILKCGLYFLIIIFSSQIWNFCNIYLTATTHRYLSRNSTLAISRLTYPWINFWKSLNNQMKNFQDFLKISVLLGFYNYFSLSFDTNTTLSTWVEQTVWIKFNFFQKPRMWKYVQLVFILWSIISFLSTEKTVHKRAV